MPNDKERVALTSIAASAGLTIAKAIVGVSTGSLALLSEAGHSLIDFGATVMTYIAVRISGKPADEKHHYGHGKVEAVSALAETALLFLLSGVVIWEAAKRLFEGGAPKIEATMWAFGVIILSIIVDYFRAKALTRAARQTQSHALEADALHFSSDLWSSAAVLFGLIGIHFGYQQADSIAALAVAALVCIAGWRLGRRTIDMLIDVAPPGAAVTIAAIALRVPGVVRIEQVRARAVGETTFIDLNVAVSRTLPLDRVSEIKKRIGDALREQMPGAEPIVSTTPIALDSETVLERVTVIARNKGLAVHHVIVHDIQDRLSISLDLEVDGKLSLNTAHQLADVLEDAIAAEMGPRVEVETHIEPLQTQDERGREAPVDRVQAVEIALIELAAAGGIIRDVHDVRVRETDEGEIINFHCRVDPQLSVQTVHENVDALERALIERSSLIKRVIGHAEPIQ